LKGNTLKSYGISGKECSAQIELLNANSSAGGIYWFYGEKDPKNFKVVYENRTTVLVHTSGKRIIGAEHLSAAAIAFQNCEFALHAPQGELPLLDGSAKLWKEELSGIAQAGSVNFYTPQRKEFEIKTSERYLKFVAGSELEIEYTIDRFGRKFNASAKIKKTEDLEKILLARTFIFEQELQVANLSENLKSCGVLIQNDEKPDFRFENEPAYHKILDFLGDISLYLNGLPCGKFSIFNGGHELHHAATNFLS